MKIIIRKAKKGDGKGIAEMFDIGLKRGFNCYTGNNSFFNNEKIKKLDKSLYENKKFDFSFVAIDSDNEKIIGKCIFWAKEKGRTRHRAEVGWGVHPDYTRKGIATELLKSTLDEAKKRGYKKIQAEAAVKNRASTKLAKKLGFKIEGRRKKGMLLDDGRYVDTYIFGKIL
jgi:RimJ/RimL family protein N-acetyltransferase